MGIFLLAIGNVSATYNGDECIGDGSCDQECIVVIDEPVEGGFYDPVYIDWHYEGDCRPVEYSLYYQEGSCDGDNWQNIEHDIGAITTEYDWDVSDFESGEYCIAVNMDQLSGPDAGSVSGVFYLDLTGPEADYNIYEGPSVPCDSEQSCDYYITQDTRIQLTCQEISDDVWQSAGPYTKYYRYSLNDGETWTDWNTYDGPFSFPEDSEHLMEFYCTDEVGKPSNTEEAILIVDSVGPEIDKSVGEPKVLCDEEEQSCDYYITQDTEICVSAEDPRPHPVGDVTIRCDVQWESNEDDGEYQVEFDEDGCFTYSEDSWHTLRCSASDALGNTEELMEYDIVDSKDPNTNLWFEGPQYGELPMWIDGVTTVNLEGMDSEPHPVGIDQTYYRTELVNDNYCTGEWYEWETTSTDDESWKVYDDPFTIQESCHVIEYYSVDLLGNEEEVQYKFVFVDKTKPKLFKEVGEPSHDCNSAWEQITGQCEENWDWIVTMGTPIYLSCQDQQPHPSGIKELCYKVTLDGNMVDSEYYGNQEGSYLTEDGFWCVPSSEATVAFYEESEHQLDFYCVDNVNKKSATDSEMFKVQGEDFTIHLEEKWNLISVPFSLLSNNIDEVFSDISDKIETVWSYDEDGWHVYHPGNSNISDLETIEPGYGYWVSANEETDLLIGGSLLSPGPSSPPARPIQPGWNLIGHYGTVEKSSYCSLFSLVDTQEGHPRWSALFGYNAVTDHFEWLDAGDNTEPGKGYWLEMDVEDTYGPSTICWGFP